MKEQAPFLVREVRAALLERAAALGIRGEREDAVIDALLEREVRVDPPSEAECRDYYARHEPLFRASTIVEVDHILFAAADSAASVALREFAQRQLDALRADGADGAGDSSVFARLARDLSNCPSGAHGGNLGQITQRDVVPEFWHAIDRFGRAGLLPHLVETRYGLHIARVQRYDAGPVLPFEAVRQRIEERLAQRNLIAALRKYTHALLH